MTLNVLNVWGELIGIGAGILVLLIFGLTFSPMVYRPKVPSGAAVEKAEPGDKEAHEAKGQERGGEHVHADGYIDSFAGLVEEAGGSLPLIASVFSIVARRSEDHERSLPFPSAGHRRLPARPAKAQA